MSIWKEDHLQIVCRVKTWNKWDNATEIIAHINSFIEWWHYDIQSLFRGQKQFLQIMTGMENLLQKMYCQLGRKISHTIAKCRRADLIVVLLIICLFSYKVFNCFAVTVGFNCFITSLSIDSSALLCQMVYGQTPCDQMVIRRHLAALCLACDLKSIPVNNIWSTVTNW